MLHKGKYECQCIKDKKPCQFSLPVLDFSRVGLHLHIYCKALMKSGIHPNYFQKASVTCSCGAVFEAGSTTEKMRTEICSQCHPFYTGKKKFIDVTGRVDRFKKLSAKSAAKKVAHLKKTKTAKTAKTADHTKTKAKTKKKTTDK